MPTLLCVPITVRTVESAIGDALLAREHGADLVEYRVDGYEFSDRIRRHRVVHLEITASVHFDLPRRGGGR